MTAVSAYWSHSFSAKVVCGATAKSGLLPWPVTTKTMPKSRLSSKITFISWESTPKLLVGFWTLLIFYFPHSTSKCRKKSNDVCDPLLSHVGGAARIRFSVRSIILSISGLAFVWNIELSSALLNLTDRFDISICTATCTEGPPKLIIFFAAFLNPVLCFQFQSFCIEIHICKSLKLWRTFNFETFSVTELSDPELSKTAFERTLLMEERTKMLRHINQKRSNDLSISSAGYKTPNTRPMSVSKKFLAVIILRIDPTDLVLAGIFPPKTFTPEGFRPRWTRIRNNFWHSDYYITASGISIFRYLPLPISATRQSRQ